jgi:glycosyltransferase involved in cell wall biosynthesis
MKIAVGSRPYDGPWGGGNRFIRALVEALAAHGHGVVHALDDRDIDLILIADPRVRSPNVCFGAGAVLRYLALRNPDAVVVHRVNECDERKGHAFINRRLVRANYVADATVFVGEWLTRLPVWQAHLRDPWFVIRNGADARLFNPAAFRPWSGDGPLRLVTHHWGYHPMKGFDVYAALDRMLQEPRWRDRIAFTYVGNLPPNFAFARARYVPPLDGPPLAAELASHHAYVTGSINEPGGNHQNEGALCGLPLLYRQSGCMPEYCAGFGVPFSGPDDLAAALESLIAGYPAQAARMPSYPHTAERMTADWIDLFEALLRERPAIVGRRRLWRDPLRALANQVPF